MSDLETLEDDCTEFLHFNYMLEELHHYSKYDLEKVRLAWAELIMNIALTSNRIVESEWFKDQLKSDKWVVANE